MNIFKGTVNKKDVNTQYVGIVAGNFTIVKGETYTLSVDTTNNGGYIYINEEYFIHNDTTHMLCNGNRKSCTAVAKVSGTYENKTLIKTGSNTTNPYNVSNIKLEIGSVASLYSGYGTGIVQNISKNGSNTSSHSVWVDRPLYGISDAVYDEINYTNKEIYHRCERVLLDGSQNLEHKESAGDGYTRFDVTLPIKPSSSAGISNKLKISGVGGTIEEKIGLNSVYKKAFLYLKNSRLETIDATGLTKYLQENPIELIYHIERYTVSNIDCSDVIVQYDGSTNIYNSDGAEIEVLLTNNKGISEINRKLAQINNVGKITKAISGSIDPHTLKTPGLYKVLESSDYTHYPIAPNGIMEIISETGNIVEQVYTHYTGQKWNTVCWYGSWSPWRPMN